MTTNLPLLFLTGLAAWLASPANFAAAVADPWAVYDGTGGPGNGKHVVLVSGDEEYRSEEALPQLGKILAALHGFKCTVLFAIDPETGVIDPDNTRNIPGLEALRTADLMIIATRFRDLPDEQMKYVAEYLDAGKPVIGMRAAVVAFRLTSPTYERFSSRSRTWKGGFGRQILGQTWMSHHGGHGRESTRGLIAPGAEDHPVVRGCDDVWGPTDVYEVRKSLSEDSDVLMLGQVVAGMQPNDKPLQGPKNDPMMPIAWTRSYRGVDGTAGRVFTTTMGAATDLKSEGFRRLLVNATYWCVGLDEQIPKEANVETVGEYDPTPFGFGKYRKGRRPSDHAWDVSETVNATARSEAAGKPNVLWLISDDHAAYVTGCYGNALVRTPQLDRLAEGGVRFDRAYCNSPVCSASRAAFITGMYPRTVGVTVLRSPLPASAVTLGEVLQDAGYDTAWYGKTHFNSGLKHGFDVVLGIGDWRRWLKEQGQTVDDTGPDVLPPWKPFRDPARLWINGVYRPFGLPDESMWDTWFARQGANFIKGHGEQPWCCVVSLTTPHSPFRFPLEYRDRHDPARFEVPEVGPEDEWQIPQVFQDLTDSEKQKVQASYYTSTEFMDKNMGIVLDALEKSGQANDTIVVYIGDHGYMLGQHGRFEKHCSYEPAVRSPLLIRYPKQFDGGRSTSAMVEFIDIMPTLLDLCGLASPPTVQGRSLAPLLVGKTDAHRTHVFVEYAWADEAMVCDDRWKLVYVRGKRRRPDGYDPGEDHPLPGPTLLLFDTQNDPDELINLARRPEHQDRVDGYVALLVEHLKQTSRVPDRIPKTEDPLVILDFCVQPHDPTPQEALQAE